MRAMKTVVSMSAILTLTAFMSAAINSPWVPHVAWAQDTELGTEAQPRSTARPPRVLELVIFRLTGNYCDPCELDVRDAIADVFGVDTVMMQRQDGPDEPLLAVRFDRNLVNAQALLEVAEATGYTVSVIER